MVGAIRSDAEAVLTQALAQEDDAKLARLIAAGDRAAFVRMMRLHNRRLYRLARAVLRDDAEAEDALQEAYLAAYKAIAGYRAQASLATPASCSTSAWGGNDVRRVGTTWHRCSA